VTAYFPESVRTTPNRIRTSLRKYNRTIIVYLAPLALLLGINLHIEMTRRGLLFADINSLRLIRLNKTQELRFPIPQIKTKVIYYLYYALNANRVIKRDGERESEHRRPARITRDRERLNCDGKN